MWAYPPSFPSATRPMSAPTTCCGGGNRIPPPESSRSTWSRSETPGSSPGSRAARSHSAAAATPSAEVAALFQQAGVVAVDTLGELFGVATVLTHTRLPAGRRLAILGNAGGPNVLAADAAAGTDLELARLSPATTDRLRQLLAPGACVDNPVDTIASVRGDAFATGLQVIAADDGVDTVLALITPTPLTG